MNSMLSSKIMAQAERITAWKRTGLFSRDYMIHYPVLCCGIFNANKDNASVLLSCMRLQDLYAAKSFSRNLDD